MRPSHAVRRQHAAAKGFTLVEAVIALGLFALVLGLLQAGLWSSRIMLRVVKSEPDPVVDALVARRILSAWFDQAAPAKDSLAGRPILFTGNATAARFPVGVSSEEGGGFALAELWIERSSGADGPRSRLGARRLPLGPTSDRGGPPSLLLDLAGDLSFRYGSQSPGSGLVWAPVWADPEKMPTRVMIASAAGPVLSFSLDRRDCAPTTGAQEGSTGPRVAPASPACGTKP